MSAPSTRSSAASPLQRVEHEVQLRATRELLDVDEPQGRAQLRRLIGEVIEEHQAAHRRGRVNDGLVDPEGMAERAFRNLARYGPLTDLLTDDDVWEIMINAPSEIFVRRHSGGSRYHHEVFHDDDHVARTLTKLLEDAASSHRKLDPTEGLQDAQLDDGSRLHIVHGDLSRGNHLMVNIRKFTGVAISSLEELVRRETLSPQAARFLAAAVRARMSIVFAGAPGAGKTTLLSCCAAELEPSLRVVIAEGCELGGELDRLPDRAADPADRALAAAGAERPESALERISNDVIGGRPDEIAGRVSRWQRQRGHLRRDERRGRPGSDAHRHAGCPRVADGVGEAPEEAGLVRARSVGIAGPPAVHHLEMRAVRLERAHALHHREAPLEDRCEC